MRKFVQLRNKSLYLLVAGILVLIVGFVFISCGGDPELKVALADNGDFAVDMSLAPGGQGAFYSANRNFPDIKGKGLTVEAWVKSKTDSLSSNIFGHWNDLGILLFVNKNEPKLAIRREISLSLPEPVGCSQLDTSTECIVDSNMFLAEDDWTHIAGVQSDSDHSMAHAPCGGAEAEIPHIDIYVDGIFQNCSTTGSLYADDPADPENTGVKLLAIAVAGESGPTVDTIPIDSDGNPTDNPDEVAGRIGGVPGGKPFIGVIDEVRVWTVARTEAQIMACKDQELTYEIPGDCYIDTAILKGYWRFNEGEGDLSADISGGGGSGGFEAPPLIPWGGAWVFPGAPITRDPASPIVEEPEGH